MTIKERLPEIKENVLLAEYTTFKIGGPAKYFFEAKTKEDLIKAIKTARDLNLPFFVLGGGSNVLVSDEEYKGVVIKCQMLNVKCQKNEIYAEAGVKLANLLKISIENSLTGLEWLAGVPGTLGGAIYGNAGWPSNKKNISAVIKSVEVLELKPKIRVKKIGLKECKFGYRESIFKNNKNLIILGGFLKLREGDKREIEKEIADILKTRKNKIPAGFSAGSVFKNPEKHSAGELIEKCGLRGHKIGRAQISEKHANFILNLGGAKAKDVLALIKLAKEKVKNKFGIILEEEIQYLK